MFLLTKNNDSSIYLNAHVRRICRLGVGSGVEELIEKLLCLYVFEIRN